MEYIISSIIIFSSWNIGNSIVGQFKVIKGVQELLSLVIAALILSAITILLPFIRF